MKGYKHGSCLRISKLYLYFPVVIFCFVFVFVVVVVVFELWNLEEIETIEGKINYLPKKFKVALL